MQNDERRIAVFIDFENVAVGVKESNYGNFNIDMVLERLVEKGKILVKRAYSDWHRYADFKRAFHQEAIELIDVPQTRYSGKNSADIRMVVDAMDLANQKEHIDTFVLVSGDSDFSPLVSKLRENGRYVIGLGVKKSSSDLLVNNCDEFIYYEDLIRPTVGPAVEDPRLSGFPPKKAEVFRLVLEAFKVLQREGKEVIYGSMIKQTLVRKLPSFNENYYGYSMFSRLLEEVAENNFLKITKDQKSGGYIVTSIVEETPEAEVSPATPETPTELPRTADTPQRTGGAPAGRGDYDRSGRHRRGWDRSQPGPHRRHMEGSQYQRPKPASESPAETLPPSAELPTPQEIPPVQSADSTVVPPPPDFLELTPTIPAPMAEVGIPVVSREEIPASSVALPVDTVTPAPAQPRPLPAKGRGRRPSRQMGGNRSRRGATPPVKAEATSAEVPQLPAKEPLPELAPAAERPGAGSRTAKEVTSAVKQESLQTTPPPKSDTRRARGTPQRGRRPRHPQAAKPSKTAPPAESAKTGKNPNRPRK
jgi:uncharacterized protein (TIGR00288 family)